MKMFALFTLASTAVFHAANIVDAAVVHYTFDVNEWVVDFKRPTTNLKKPAERQTPFSIPDENRKGAILVNGVYPGPTVECFVNDTVIINVVNNMISESTTIHWHGVHPVDQPWADGATQVTQAPIRPGENFTYEFRAWPQGTHYWHSHMDGMQSAKGMRGPFIIKPKPGTDPNDPEGNMYEDKVVVLADEWQNPDVCLKLEGAMAGNDVCSDIDWASINGQIATGDKQKFDKRYPYPLVDVAPGKCYRLRIIAMMSNAENYIFSIAGHQMTLVALDGVDVEPLKITAINMHIGERADVLVCADQKPGYYPIEMNYDYACDLTPGNFIPPGFHAVTSCKFYGFLHYTGQKENILTYGPPNSPKGTGGGKNPVATHGVRFDLTDAWNWNKTRPVEARPEPEEPDVRYVISLGLEGPVYKDPDTTPLTHGRWYIDIDGRRQSWKNPTTPLLHTKGGQTGCKEDVPVLDIPEDAVNVELVINNLAPTAHTLHMHGLMFQVINFANFQWCNVNKTACFLMPYQLNPCPKEDRQLGDEKNKGGLLDMYWGCTYNEAKDKHTQNLAAPLRKDSFQVWQRSWAVIRFQATWPGVWLFHCHMEQHVPLGMIMALNILPSKQKPIPGNVPTDGPCPVWSAANKRPEGI